MLLGSCIWGASIKVSTDVSIDISVDVSVDNQPSIGRYSVEYRSIYRSRFGRVSTDDADGISRRIDRDTVGGISVNYRLYIGRLSVVSVDTRPSVNR